MRQKLWITLLTATLLALLCLTAAASDYNFTTEPQDSYEYDPSTLSCKVSWVTDFTPVRVEIVRRTGSSYANYEYMVAATLDSPKKSDSYTFHTTDLNWSGTYLIRAYYRDTNWISSYAFTVSTDSLDYTAEPEDGQAFTYDPATLTCTVPWTTNFTPTRVEIVRRTGSSYANYEYMVAATLDSPKADDSYTFHTADENWQGTYLIRAYYRDTSWISSYAFTVSTSSLDYTSEPGDGQVFTYDPATLTCTVPWKTTFKPVRVEIVRRTGSSYSNYEYTVIATLNSPKKSDSYVFRTTDQHWSGTFLIRAYYRDTNRITSNAFTVSTSSLAFTQEPADTSLLAPVTVGFGTNFRPVRCELYNVNTQKVVTPSPAFGADGQTVTLDHRHRGTFRIRAYYNSNNYVISDPFTVTGECGVVFDVQGVGTAPAAQPISAGGRAVRPTDPAATGWRFGGWFTDKDCTTPYDFSTSVTYMRVLYAKWDMKTFTVTFRANGRGSDPAPQTVQEGQRAEYLQLTYNDLLFGGWYTEPGCVNQYTFSAPVMGDITLYAWWGHIVTFDHGDRGPDSSELAWQFVRIGKKAVCPDYFTEPGEDGWYVYEWVEINEYGAEVSFDFADTVNRHLMLHADWRFDGSEITYDWDGHTVTRYEIDGTAYDTEGETSVIMVRTGEMIPLPVPTAYEDYGGYTFLGWYLGANTTPFEPEEAGDQAPMRLYAKWARNPRVQMYFLYPNEWHDTHSSYNVRYGTVPAESDTFFRGFETVSTPSNAPGWAFTGWYTDEDCTVPFDKTLPVTADVDLYAGWEQVTYTVRFVSDGEPAEVETRALHYGDTITRPETLPEKEGFVISAWRDADGRTMWATGGYVTCTCEGNAVFEAVWVPDGIRIDQYSFPDDNFRALVSDKKIDTNEDGVLSPAECSAVTAIACSGMEISSLQGIGYFTELKNLHCYNNRLTALDLSGNPKLVTVNCYNNQLTALDLSNNPEVTSVYAQNNCLTSVNLVRCTKMTNLNLYDNPDLTELELNGPVLRILKIYRTGITGMDLTGCPGLALAVVKAPTYQYNSDGYETRSARYNGWMHTIYVDINAPSDGFITEGILINEANFPDQGFRTYVLEKVDTNGNGALTPDETAAVYSINNYASSVTVMKNLQGSEFFPGLTVIQMLFSGLTELDLSGNPAVSSIGLYNTALTALDVTGLTQLTTLSVTGSVRLETVTLGDAPLTYLYLADDPALQSLDISGQPALLKAVMEGERTVSGSLVRYSWRWSDGHQNSLVGTLETDAGVQIPVAHWEWTGVEEAAFILPDGRSVPAGVTRTPNADGTTVTFTATVAFGQYVFEDSRTYLPVTFEGTDEPERLLQSGDYLAQPEDPFVAGQIFLGWCLDADGTEPVDFAAPVTAGFTVYAVWNIPAPEGFIRLPDALRHVENAAFESIPAEAAVIPPSVETIAPNAFAPSEVRYIYGIPGTLAETYANVYGFTFVPVDDAWLASH